MEVNIKFKKLAYILIFSAILIFIGILCAKLLGFSRGGFEDTYILTQYIFYAFNGAAFLLGIICLYVASLIMNTEDELGDSLCFFNSGETPALPGKFFKNPLRLIFFSSMITGMLGLISTVNNTMFTGVGLLGQTFTKLDNLVFTSLLVPIAENLDLAFLLACMIFIIRIIARKKSWSKNNFIAVCVILSLPLGGFYGIANHLLRYSSQEASLVTVFWFWGLGSAATILIGNFIFLWIAHLGNNLYYTLRKFFSFELARNLAFAQIVVSFILFILTFVIKTKNKVT